MAVGAGGAIFVVIFLACLTFFMLRMHLQQIKNAAKLVRVRMQGTSRRQRSAPARSRPSVRSVVLVTTQTTEGANTREVEPPPYSMRPLSTDAANPPPYSAIPMVPVPFFNTAIGNHVNSSINHSNQRMQINSDITDVNYNEAVHIDEATSRVTWTDILPPEGDGPPPYDSISVTEMDPTGSLLPPPSWSVTQTGGATVHCSGSSSERGGTNNGPFSDVTIFIT